MKIDLPISLDIPFVDEAYVLLVIMLIAQAVLIALWAFTDMKKCNSPVERLVRDRYFGGV